MIKNRMPLRNILIIILLTVMFFMICFGYGLSLENYRNQETRLMMTAFAIGSLLLGLLTVGIWLKRKGARVALRAMLYLLILVWTFFGYMWFSDIGNSRILQKIFPIVFSIFIYCILVAGITFLNNPLLIEEFEEEEN